MQSEIEKTALNKMIKARTHLLFDNPFIGAQAIKYNLIPSENYNGIQVNTAMTNGKEIVFNPAYINQLSFNQVKFLLAHESFHCMLGHHVRRSGRDHETWNNAGDYVINDILLSEKIGEEINGLLIDSKYSGQNTESVFKDLYQEKQDQNSQKNTGDSIDSQAKSSPGARGEVENGTSQGNETDISQKVAKGPAGDVIDAPKDLTTAEIESELKESIQSAMNYTKKAGKLPGPKIQKMIGEILAPKANWKDLLKQWIDSTDKTDVSFIRPKDHGTGYFSPGYYSEGLNRIIIAIDISGSVLSVPKAIEIFQSEINSLKNAYQFDCQVIYFHSKIEKIETYQRHEQIKIHIEETGGTQIKPVFDYIQDNGLNNQISGLIVFTDLEICDFPKHETGYKTLFVKYGDSQYLEKAPIGETITIKD